MCVQLENVYRQMFENNKQRTRSMFVQVDVDFLLSNEIVCCQMPSFVSDPIDARIECEKIRVDYFVYLWSVDGH